MFCQKIKFFIFFFALGAGFFCYSKNALAVNIGEVVINEICVHGTSASDEFVELYNNSINEKDISSWKLQYKSDTGTTWSSKVGAGLPDGTKIKPKGFFLLAGKSYAGGTIPDFRHTVDWNLKDTAGHVRLIDANETEIDRVGYGASANNPETLPAPTPAFGQSITRNTDGPDTNDNSLDFVVLITPTPQNYSYISSESNNTTTSTTLEIPLTITPSTSTPSTPIRAIYNFGDVVINEFVPDPADEMVEFIELYNKRSENINLDGWFIYDGSGAKTVLSGSLEKYFVVEKPKGNLNNAGDLIILKQGETIIDQVVYGNWKDGNADDNAPTASDHKSIARKGDGFNTYNNKNDFAVTAKITKGGANIIADDDMANVETFRNGFGASLPNEYSSDIIINEILPHPSGDEDNGEFIELFNKSNVEVDLEGWSLGDSSTRKYSLKKADKANDGIASSSQAPPRNDNIIKPQGYFVVYRKDSKIALNNSGDEVKLYYPGIDSPIQTVKYEKATEGQSYNLINATSTVFKWDWSEIITPAAANVIKISHEPTVSFDWLGEQTVGQIISFDSSDTEDADGDNLKFLWNFGTGATSTESNPIYIYLTPGNFQVSLAVSDNEHTVKEEKIIKIKEGEEISVKETAAGALSSNSAENKAKSVKGVKIANAAKNSSSTNIKTNTNFIKTTLENIREFAAGDWVRVEGTVVVLPGIFSSQFFYIVGSPRSTSSEMSGQARLTLPSEMSGQAGVQVYNNKKLFPALAIGDKISVAGQLSESYGELRLKTKVVSDIKKVATGVLPAPAEISADEIGEETEAQLVRVSGTVVDKKSFSIWLDDGNGEMEIYCKQGAKINKENINEGDKISVTGIVSQSNEKYRVLPRSNEDIIKQNNAAQSGQVLGEISTSDSWQLAQNDKKMKLIEYLLILSGGLIVVLVGLLWKIKK